MTVQNTVWEYEFPYYVHKCQTSCINLEKNIESTVKHQQTDFSRGQRLPDYVCKKER